jgi:activator of HSP90 ATPase
MSLDRITRRDFSGRLGWWLPLIGMSGAAMKFGSPAVALAASTEEISRTNEAIHQEVAFKANRTRVYEALMDSKQFDAVTKLSKAMTSGMVPAGSAAASVSREAGGAFSAFGGYVTGRQIELLPGQRIVQAWRAGSWEAGVYSIARFELLDQGAGTKLVFDHTGFPSGEAAHLAEGWNGNYWEPLAKFLR